MQYVNSANVKIFNQIDSKLSFLYCIKILRTTSNRSFDEVARTLKQSSIREICLIDTYQLKLYLIPEHNDHSKVCNIQNICRRGKNDLKLVCLYLYYVLHSAHGCCVINTHFTYKYVFWGG